MAGVGSSDHAVLKYWLTHSRGLHLAFRLPFAIGLVYAMRYQTLNGSIVFSRLYHFSNTLTSLR